MMDRERLKKLAEESKELPAYMRAELGYKAPDRVQIPDWRTLEAELIAERARIETFEGELLKEREFRRQLQAENAELRRDRARLTWLENWFKALEPEWNMIHVDSVHRMVCVYKECDQEPGEITVSSIREAIDLAMAAASNETEGK